MNDPFVPGMKLIFFVETGWLLLSKNCLCALCLPFSFIVARLQSGTQQQSDSDSGALCGQLSESLGLGFEASKQRPVSSGAGLGSWPRPSGSPSLCGQPDGWSPYMKRKQSMSSFPPAGSGSAISSGSKELIDSQSPLPKNKISCSF